MQALRRPQLPVRTDAGRSPSDARLTRAVAKHRDRLTGMLAHSGLGSGDVDDAVQEAFWVLARRLDQVPERAERAFLTSTALKMASDRRRSTWNGIIKQQASIDEWNETCGESPDALVQRFQDRTRVDVALSRLESDERSVFLLSEVEELSRTEVAHLLNLPAGTVASRLARARSHFLALSAELRKGSFDPGPLLRKGDISRVVGSQRFTTNAWGQDKTRGQFEHNLVTRKQAGQVQLGWHWYWPGFDRSSFAYPEVLIGWKPWEGGVSTDPRLPIQVQKAKGLLAHYRVEVRATGSYNLAFCSWLCGSGRWTVEPNKESIVAELMVWPDYTPGLTPPGRFVSSVTLEGQHYEIWHAPRHGKEDKGDGKGWTALTLRGVGGHNAGTIPLGAGLGELVSRGLVDPELYLTSVELGNEIMGGAGTTFVEGFSIEF